MDQFLVRNSVSGRFFLVDRPRIDGNGSFQSPSMSWQNAYRQASTYANFAHGLPVYECKALEASLNPYQMAMIDYLGKPEVLEIDIREWTGGIFQPIRIRARDNILALSVRLMIRENKDSQFALDAGEAVQSEEDPLLWTYTTTTPIAIRPGIRLDAFAYDLPGNVGELSLELQ